MQEQQTTSQNPNTFDKIRLFCRKFRIILGVVLIVVGFFISNPWFYLGILPLVAGIINFCPLCLVTKKCTV